MFHFVAVGITSSLDVFDFFPFHFLQLIGKQLFYLSTCDMTRRISDRGLISRKFQLNVTTIKSNHSTDHANFPNLLKQLKKLLATTYQFIQDEAGRKHKRYIENHVNHRRPVNRHRRNPVIFHNDVCYYRVLYPLACIGCRK